MTWINGTIVATGRRRDNAKLTESVANSRNTDTGSTDTSPTSVMPRRFTDPIASAHRAAMAIGSRACAGTGPTRRASIASGARETLRTSVAGAIAPSVWRGTVDSRPPMVPAAARTKRAARSHATLVGHVRVDGRSTRESFSLVSSADALRACGPTAEVDLWHPRGI